MSAQMRRRDIAALALTALAAPRPTFAAATAPQPAPSETDSTTHEMFERMRRMSIDVVIDGEGPFRFLVDTGANGSAISDALAARLGMQAQSGGVVHGIAGARAAPSVVAGRVQVGSRVKRRMTFSVLPAEALAADGLLGLEWLNNQRLIFDFDESRLRIEPGFRRASGYVGSGWDEGGSVVAQADVLSGRLNLVRSRIGPHSVRAFIDSGSYCTLGNEALYRAARQANLISRELGAVEVVGATGDALAGRFAILRTLRLGGIGFREVPLVIAPVHTFRFWGMDDHPMILVGMDILRVFGSVSVDFANQEVAFRPRRS